MRQLCCLGKLSRRRVWRRRHVVLGRRFSFSDDGFHRFHVYFQDSERASWHHAGPPTQLQVRERFGFNWNCPPALVGINVWIMIKEEPDATDRLHTANRGHISDISLAKKGPSSIVNLYEAQKSLSNKTSFCWWRWQICVTCKVCSGHCPFDSELHRFLLKCLVLVVVAVYPLALL